MSGVETKKIAKKIRKRIKSKNHPGASRRFFYSQPTIHFLGNYKSSIFKSIIAIIQLRTYKPRVLPIGGFYQFINFVIKALLY